MNFNNKIQPLDWEVIPVFFLTTSSLPGGPEAQRHQECSHAASTAPPSPSRGSASDRALEQQPGRPGLPPYASQADRGAEQELRHTGAAERQRHSAAAGGRTRRGLAAALGFCSFGSRYDPVLRQTELFVPAALVAPEQGRALKERGAEALRTLLLAFKKCGLLGPPLPLLFGGLWSGLATSPWPRVLAKVCVLFPRGFHWPPKREVAAKDGLWGTLCALSCYLDVQWADCFECGKRTMQTQS